eukprot:gene1045-1872_t
MCAHRNSAIVWSVPLSAKPRSRDSTSTHKLEYIA